MSSIESEAIYTLTLPAWGGQAHQGKTEKGSD